MQISLMLEIAERVELLSSVPTAAQVNTNKITQFPCCNDVAIIGSIGKKDALIVSADPFQSSLPTFYTACHV